MNVDLFKLTFVFDATDPAAADFVGTETPNSIQMKLDADGNGTQTLVAGYSAIGTDGSRVLVQGVFHFEVVGFTTFIPTLDRSTLHCF